MKVESMLSLIGDTPLIRLSNLFEDLHFKLYGKLEMFNATGSVKDRPAIKIVEQAFEKGQISPGATIVESSSGNMGIGLAMVCARMGLKLVCVMDLYATSANRRIIELYGAKVDMVEKPDASGSYLGARLKRVEELIQTIPNSFNCDQYHNLNHPRAHHVTAAEIVKDLGTAPDYLFCTTSTCGTLRGCAEFFEAHDHPTKIIAVDAQGSVIFGDLPKTRLIPGHGASIPPPLYYEGLAHDYVLTSDVDCIQGCRSLAARESIFAGGSTGAVVSAIRQLRHRIEPGAQCVAIFCDWGVRYLDTIYSDSWVREHFGDVPLSWVEEVTPEFSDAQ